MKKWQKVAISIIVIMSFLAMSISVFAVDPTPTPTPEINDGIPDPFETLVPYYVWLCMRAWGIQISYNDFIDYTDEVGDMLWNWIIEYLAELPSSYSINEWIAPWQSSYDYWGNYQFNDSALEDIQEFVNWLITKFGLDNNETVVIDPNYNLNGYTVYDFNVYYRVYDYNGGFSNEYYAVKISEQDNFYPVGYINVLYTYSGQQRTAIVALFLYNESNRMAFQTNAVDIDGNASGSGGATFNATNGPSSGGIYWQKVAWSNTHVMGGNNPVVTTYSNVDAFMQNAELVTEGNQKFIVSTLNLPYQDNDYTSGDSITLIGDKPQYSLIEWSGEVTITNLPAVVSTGQIPTPGDENNPGLVAAFRPISSLIDVVSDSMAVVVGIIYEFPEEVIIPIYAVMGGMILFGVIKLMREH